MIRIKNVLVLMTAVLVCGAGSAFGQGPPEDFRQEFLAQFNASSRKIVSLADAMPAEKYSWSPSEGIMSVSDVFMHVARYNYYYPESALGVETPEYVDLGAFEGIDQKEKVLEELRRSIEHLRGAVEAMPESRLRESTRLYNRDVAGWAVLLQLLSHMNEHVGQSIAYARMNGVAPPWSN